MTEAKWCCKGVKTDDPTVDQHEEHCQYHSKNWKQQNVAPATPEYHHQFVDVPAMQEDLIQRAAELLRRSRYHGLEEQRQIKFELERQQWLSDAGLLAVENPDVKSHQQD